MTNYCKMLLAAWLCSVLMVTSNAKNLGAALSGSGRSRNKDANVQSGTDGPKPTSDTCTGEYQNIPGHTMCMNDNPRVQKTGVTAQEKQEIMRIHNEVRRTAMPEATDLTVLVWNEELAAVAQKWSQQCQMGHDQDRSVPDIGMSIGQNVAGGYLTWEQAIGGWHEEVKMYVFGREPDSYLGKGNWVQIGHYTQMVQNTTHQVGCGFSRCTDTRYGRYYVCNYASGQSRLAVPYIQGPRCSACPNNCRNGLCDCGGRLCLNGGTLDVASCTCQCPPVYKGADCSQPNCPSEDPYFCGRDFLPSTCKKYFNVPHMCPYMCGVCSGGSKEGAVTNNVGGQVGTPEEIFTSSFGCKYEGKRATPAECKAFGDKGADKQFCASQGGKSAGCNECSLYYNIKRDYCPVMCGLCDPPCEGKTCKNGGRLDTETCTCECKAPFVGDTCDRAVCPAEDQIHCSMYDAFLCSEFVNVPVECPYLCGICKH